MTEIATWLGAFIMVLGGLLATAAIICFFGWLLCKAWVSFSNRFRDVCRAEKLIFEYRFYKQEFLEWKRARNGGDLSVHD